MNIIFFITHKTLGKEHAEMVFRSMSMQQTKKKFDLMVVYNSHQEELPNTELLSLFLKYNLDRVIEDVVLFDYDASTHKSLGADIAAIRDYCRSAFQEEDRVLLLKSDCCLSKNYFDVILSLEPGSIHFVAPFVCAKKRVPDDIIVDYLSREAFIRSDDITFFVEDTHQSGDNDFANRNVSATDESILFTSCTVTRDFSCHFISVDLLDSICVRLQSWGGCNFGGLDPYLRQSEQCFVVHKYHSIVSENRSMDREGPVEIWLTS
jgi:hypothetical protein